MLPLWSWPILFLTPSQSHTPLPQVIELPLPSPTSTEGPDPTESDYTASSSSSFSFTSSSFYATSSSSTSDKVSRMATLSKKGKGFPLACLETFGFLTSFSLCSFFPRSSAENQSCASLLLPLVDMIPFSLPHWSDFLSKKMGWSLEWLSSLRFASLWRRCKGSSRGNRESHHFWWMKNIQPINVCVRTLCTVKCSILSR